MEKLYYDMHIHSALSPCGDNDMTPNNIVNMSIIKGLDIIAVTDHNSCGNVEAVMKAADGKILVVPGMEIETSEEIHVVSYFPDLESALKTEAVVKDNLPFIENNTEIYGNQYFMDENDEITGEEKSLLVSATQLDLYSVVRLVKDNGGVPVPAHIDRSSYSVLSNLGFLPEDLGVTAVEITPMRRKFFENDYLKYNILSNSDAHYLENISECEFFIEIIDKNIKEVLKYLCKIE
ncbi:MAG: PHP domain-containing protein [Clostridia bacterium]|nr:PHP domain-containing protein [Clostridia bacterium]